jgi:TIR domain
LQGIFGKFLPSAGSFLPNIFISHSGKDDDWALALRDWLAREGWDDSFLDLSPERDVPTADRWTSALLESAAHCEVVLLLVSQQWLVSDVCEREYELASQLGKMVIALLIKNISLAQIPAPMTATHQLVDLTHQLVDLTGHAVERFEIVNPRNHRESSVFISKEGLSRLKLALQRAAIGGAVIDRSPSIFVSFSSQDKTQAIEIVNLLEAAALKCWISCRDVPHGEDFQDAIVSALERSSAMILVFSQNADNSREIKKELALASESGLFVLPVRIENAEPTKGFRYQLATRQYINLFENREKNMALIIDALKRHLRAVQG